MKRMKTVLGFIIAGTVAGCSGGAPAAVTEQAGRQTSEPTCSGNRGCPTEELCNPGDTCANPRQVCCPHRPGPDVPFTCGPLPCFRGGGELCQPGDQCAVEGDVCCPHAPGPRVPFTCSADPCFR